MTNEKDLIAGTIDDLRESLEVLRSHMKELAEEIRRKEERLAAWEIRLKTLEGESAPAAGRVRKRPKGANLRTIGSFLAGRLEGETAGQIREKTGLPWSSVQRVLDMNRDVFEEQDGGLWRLTPEGAKKFGKGAFNVNGFGHEREGMTDQDSL